MVKKGDSAGGRATRRKGAVAERFIARQVHGKRLWAGQETAVDVEVKGFAGIQVKDCWEGPKDIATELARVKMERPSLAAYYMYKFDHKWYVVETLAQYCADHVGELTK